MVSALLDFRFELHYLNLSGSVCPPLRNAILDAHSDSRSAHVSQQKRNDKEGIRVLKKDNAQETRHNL